jgi:hypothetical protein
MRGKGIGFADGTVTVPRTREPVGRLRFRSLGELETEAIVHV